MIQEIGHSIPSSDNLLEAVPALAKFLEYYSVSPVSEEPPKKKKGKKEKYKKEELKKEQEMKEEEELKEVDLNEEEEELEKGEDEVDNIQPEIANKIRKIFSKLFLDKSKKESNWNEEGCARVLSQLFELLSESATVAHASFLKVDLLPLILFFLKSLSEGKRSQLDSKMVSVFERLLFCDTPDTIFERLINKFPSISKQVLSAISSQIANTQNAFHVCIKLFKTVTVVIKFATVDVRAFLKIFVLPFF